MTTITEERRTSPRRAASLAAEIETETGRASAAITRDVSEGGLLVFSRRSLNVGDVVKIKLVVGDVVHHVAGKIVRQEKLAVDESAVWRSKVGVVVEGDPGVLASVLAAVDA